MGSLKKLVDSEYVRFQEYKGILSNRTTNLLLALSSIEADRIKTVQAHREELQRKVGEAEERKRAVEEENRNLQMELNQIRGNIQAFKNKMDNEVARKADVENKLAEVVEEASEMEGAIKEKQNANDEAKLCLKSILDFFPTRLGLRFKKTSNSNSLACIFTQIGPSAVSEKKCLISLNVDTGKYKVVACDPLVPELNKLLNKLNDTNNLLAFFCAVRKRFQELEAK